MNKKFLIPIIGAFAFAMTYTVSNSTLSENGTPMFLESENIAYAGGYTCAPKNWEGCPFGAGNLFDYIKVVPPPVE